MHHAAGLPTPRELRCLRGDAEGLQIQGGFYLTPALTDRYSLTTCRRASEREFLERDPLDTPGRTLSEFIAYGTESVARPLTSLAQQLAHRLLGSPEMAAQLSMRRSMLSVPGAPSSGQSGQRRSFLDWLPASVWPLFEILRGRQPADTDQVRCYCLSLAFSMKSQGWCKCILL